MNYNELAEAYAWEPIPSKNKYMVSFIKDTRRMNIYFTTGTVTVQDSEARGKCDPYRDVMDDTSFEEVLMKHK